MSSLLSYKLNNHHETSQMVSDISESSFKDISLNKKALELGAA